MARNRTLLLSALLGLAALTACSSAPAPTTLTQNGGTTGGVQAPATGGTLPGGTGGGTTGVAAPGTSGDGTSGGTTGTTGGSSGTATSGDGGSGGTSTGGSGSGTGGGTGGADTHSHLFTPAENNVGITKTSLTMCAHAALTYGKAFNTTDADFNVFWQAINEEKGGIYGRKVAVTYENDNYDPNTAVTAAQTCADKGIFMLLGGIGFDQIPAVRRWAESHHMLYLHHTATIQGSQGLKYSFTELPSVERMGSGFAQLYLSKFKGKKVGIAERDSPNWAPGADLFKKMLAAQGIKPVADQHMKDKKANYTEDILALKNQNAEVVWLWENALNATEFIKQAKAQQYNPIYLMFPFNLTSQTLGNDALTPKLEGVAMYPAFSKGDYSGGFAHYADDVKLFEQQYAKYDKNADLSGVGGDLLFLNWVGQKALYEQFLECGPDCNRNKFVDVLQGYHKVPTSSACLIDFTEGDHHHGSEALNFMETYTSPSGKVNWHNTQSCVMP